MGDSMKEASAADLAENYDWDKFDRELLFEGLDPGVSGVGDSSFRAILTRLLVPKGCATLDVGAGGFLGFTTTRHLVEVLDAQVDAVEIDTELSQKLDQKFAGRIKVYNMPIQDFPRAGRQYDVIVSDLNTVPWQINTFAPDWLENLKPGGYYIFCTVYDLAAMFDGKEPLMELPRRPEYEKFLLDRFGTTILDPRTAQKGFLGSQLTVRAIVDKWSLKSPRRGFGFIVLQKNGPKLSDKPVPYESQSLSKLAKAAKVTSPSTADRYTVANYDWEKFDRDLLFKGLDPGVAGVGDSAFRAIVTRLLVPKGCSTLDIGSGGFLGNTTTRHLVEVLDAEVDAVEIDVDLARKLDEKFAGRIKVHAMAIQDFPRAGRQYDVIVADLPIVPWQINEFAPDWLENLKPGGYYIFCTVYDLVAMFDGKEPLMDISVRPGFEKFLLDRFGTTTIDPQTAQKSFIGSPLTVRAIVDKWCMKSPRRGFGFIVLQKEGPLLSDRPVPYEVASPARPAKGQAPQSAESANPPSLIQRAVAAFKKIFRG